MNAVTLQSLIYSMAVNLNSGDSVAADLTGITTAQGRQWVEYIRRAYKDHYETAFPWPESIETATATLTAGHFTRSTIGYGDWFEAWSEDPRPLLSKAYPINARADASYIWCETSLASVFVLYRAAAPRLAYTPVVGGTTYAAGSVVYDNTTRDCYEALVSALGSALSDTAKWRRLQLIAQLDEATLMSAQGYYMLANGKPDEAAKLMQSGRAKREGEFTKAFPIGAFGRWWARNVNT